MNIGKIGKKGQIVIPKKIRERLHIGPNDAFSFNVRANTIIMKKIQADNEGSLIDILEQCKPFDSDFLSKMRDEWS